MFSIGNKLLYFCFQIEDFASNAYDFPVYFPNESQVIQMHQKSQINDVGLFIGSLLSFNDLSLNSEFVDTLFQEEELALD